MQARLIKRHEINSQHQQSKATAKSVAKNAVEIVRDWIGQRQQNRQSARESFNALFAKTQVSGAA